MSPPYQLFGNTLNNYKQFDNVLTHAREKGDVDWTRIQDLERTLLGGEGSTFSTRSEYADWVFNMVSERFFDRSYWDKQPGYIEVWVEKKGLGSLFEQALDGLRVHVFPSRGYSSLTKIMEAIERFPKDKPVKILHFADHDPSGLDMTEDLAKRLASYSGLWDEKEKGLGFRKTSYEIEVKRVALGIGQVRSLNLPSNPTKAADARSPGYLALYGDRCWELDAIPPLELQRWVREAVEAEIDRGAWEAVRRRVEEDKDRIGEALSAEKESVAYRRMVERVKRAVRE